MDDMESSGVFFNLLTILTFIWVGLAIIMKMLAAHRHRQAGYPHTRAGPQKSEL
jgi:hypothetical protein